MGKLVPANERLELELLLPKVPAFVEDRELSSPPRMLLVLFDRVYELFPSYVGSVVLGAFCC